MLLNPEMFESCEASSICLNGTSYDSNLKLTQFSKDFGTFETKTKIEMSKSNQLRKSAVNLTNKGKHPATIAQPKQ